MLTRLLDIIVSLFGLLVLFLLLPVIGLLIKIDSRGPIFIPCDRVGKGGRIFKMYKFRTMYHTPQPVGASVSPNGDPRVTQVGLWLRRSKLNELPQFLNILKGDMTLIGPRPEAPDLAAAYPPEARKIFSVKPGLAGPNQILGRNEEDWFPPGVSPHAYYLEKLLPQRIAVDLEYLEEKSFLTDLKYIFLAAWVTISGAISRQHLTDNSTQILMLGLDTLCCLLSFTLAHVIRFEGFSKYTSSLISILPLTVLTRIPLFIYLGFYQTLIRHLHLYDLKRVFLGVSVGSGLLVIFGFFSGLTPRGYSRSVFIIDWFCLATLLIGYRGILKSIFLHYQSRGNGQPERRRALIWGAGTEGSWCLRFLRESQDPLYEVVGFIDEDPRMRRRGLDGVKVLGDSSHLEILTQLYKVEEVFVAWPDAPPPKMERLQKTSARLAISLKRFVPRTIEELPEAPWPQVDKQTPSPEGVGL
jgi:lipopolysaccharide/colanic/teichoic acid biosynthesis glycosyltransferase